MFISKTRSAQYNEICQQQMEILKAEAIIRSKHSEIAMISNSKDSFSRTDLEIFKEAAKIVSPYLKLKSHYLNRFIYNIIYCRYLAEFDYKNIIKYCDEALSSFPSDHMNGIALKFAYMQKKLTALIALGDLDKAKTLAKEACTMMTIGNFNWHLAFLRRITVCLYSGDYQEAYDLYKAHAKQNCSFPVLVEYWKIIWGYLFFLIQVGKIEAYKKERFHLGKLLNEVPIYSRDKAGNNINLLIIQIITRIYREQYSQLIDRMEALESYARTYTQKPETKRANIFIKMILKMDKATYHRVATERNTKQLYKQLLETPLRLGQNLAIEVIPYEVLWTEILNLLENKFRVKKIRKTNTRKQGDSH